MSGYGLANPDTRRKAMTFYVAWATYAGLPLSPHLRPAKSARPAGQQRPRPAKKRASATARPVPAPSPASEAADMRRVYFDLLISKAKDTTSDDAGLLDRIERLVGVMETQEADKS